MARIEELTSIPIHRFDLLPNLIHRIGVILNLFSRRLLIAAGHESNEEQQQAFADFSRVTQNSHPRSIAEDYLFSCYLFSESPGTSIFPRSSSPSASILTSMIPLRLTLYPSTFNFFR